MYLPAFNRMDDQQVGPFLDAVAAAEVVTVRPDGYPEATLMPFVREGDRLLLHMARGNPHWRGMAAAPSALAVVGGPQAYVSPSWYAAKREHGRVVPTWNYSVVHLYGQVTVHDDARWVREVVDRLTRLHEAPRDEPWAVSDAPADYVEHQLKAIVGIELLVERVEAKAKLSQNRSDADRAGVVAGLEREAGPAGRAVATAMREAGLAP